MTDYTELVRKMRTCIGDKKCFEKECRYWSELGCMDGNICCDAAAAIEDLQAQLPKRGGWVGVSHTVDTVQCSICGGQLFSAELETPYCPYCGAKMEVQE